ncbi:MAG TPA: hypothetical protein VMH00_09480 [Candidatus Limnocylindrales bacterium]|nr:hypothetical protein [Candidatus Limnocylindrales bacterium]
MNRGTASTLGIAILVISCFGLMTGCGDGTSAPPAIIVSVIPATPVTLQSGQSEQFTATVKNDPTNRGVTWSISNVVCTAALCGTIDATGKYLSPATVTSNFPGIGIVATSIADPTKSASGSVTLLAPSSPPITVILTPGNTNVQIGQIQQFSAQVQNDPSNQGVTWSVGDYVCDAGCGTIDQTGKYTPPTAIEAGDSEAEAEIIATSVADPTKQALASVRITPVPTGISVTPSNATVQNNGAQQFIAQGVPEGAIPVVNWALSGTGCAGATCGTIDPTGMYTAPASTPNPPMVTVTAASVAGGSVSGSATVLLGANANNSKLTGSYAFQIHSDDLNDVDTGGGSVIAGTLTADGSGNITGGVFDGYFSIFSGNYLCNCLNTPILGGTYSVGSDNRGAMTLVLGSDFDPDKSYSFSLSFALGSIVSGVAGRGKLGGGISSGVGEVRIVSGTLARQDPSAFSSDAIAGDFAFFMKPTPNFGLYEPTSFTWEATGRFTAKSGLLSAGQTDTLGNGPGIDSQPLSFAGTYNVDARGRGTAKMSFDGSFRPFSDFVFYVISANELLFVETDGITNETANETLLVGTALRRSAGPFTASSLSGSTVVYSGDVLNNDVFRPGDLNVELATFDGTSAVGGTSDTVDQNNVATSVPFSGSYTVDGDGLGRGTLSLSGPQFPGDLSTSFYFVASGKAFVLGLGTLESQSGGPFTNASISGSYVLNAYGVFFGGSSSGILTADGDGSLSGTVDAIDGNGFGMGSTFSGAYAIDASGRGTLTTTPPAGPPMNWILYIVSPSKILFRQALYDFDTQLRAAIEK